MNHHANGYDEGDETVILSSGWGPKQLKALKSSSNTDTPPVGSLKLSAFGDYTAMPRTALWEHRSPASDPLCCYGKLTLHYSWETPAVKAWLACAVHLPCLEPCSSTRGAERRAARVPVLLCWVGISLV